MLYVSTRGGTPPKSFTEILMEGLAPDGGLYVPQAVPRLTQTQLAEMRPMNYRELAFAVLSHFVDDLPRADLCALVNRTYTPQVFRSEEIAPLRTLEPELHILGLSNGPTLAFKDMAMQFLGNLFEYVLARDGRELNILGATSGDTGSSAEYAMRGKKGIRVFMLSPWERMSPFQAGQMYSLQDPNIFNIAIRGVFDQCQDIVKAVSNDAQFKARHHVGTVNSINWARIAAQVVYYFKAYFAATRREGEPVSFAVPSGNFGNIYAGHVARRMGLPVRRLILATNENNVLDEFFRTGVYRVRKDSEVCATSSPSMDISKASNFERYAFDLLGGDAMRVRELWTRIEGAADGARQFDLSSPENVMGVEASGFVSGFSTHADRIATMRSIWRNFGVMVDTHTADGIKVGLAFRESGVPLICLETALPVKFALTVREALGRDPERPAGYENIETLPQRVEVLDPDVAAVQRYMEGRMA